MTNAACPEDKELTVPVSFRVAEDDAVVMLYTYEGAVVLEPDADGMYTINSINGEYAFVTVE